MDVETKTDNSQRQSSGSSQPILVDTNYGRLPLSELRDDGVCVVQLPFSHSAQLFVNANQVADNNQRKLKRSDEVEDEQKDEFVPVKRQNSLPRADGAATLPTNLPAAPFTPVGSISTFGSRNSSFNVSDPIHNPFAQPADSPFAQQTQQASTSFPLFGSNSAAANHTASAQIDTTEGQQPLFQPRGSSIPPHHTQSINDATAPATSTTTQPAAADEMMQ